MLLLELVKLPLQPPRAMRFSRNRILLIRLWGRDSKQLAVTVKACLLFGVISIVIYLYCIGLLSAVMSLPYSRFTYPLEIDFRRLLSSLEHTHKPPEGIRPINDDNFAFLHENAGRCLHNRTYNLLILVKSSSSHFYFREVLRSMWANPDSFSPGFLVQYVFVIGSPEDAGLQRRIDKEQEKFGDIVQQDFIDAYFNNTYKTMLAFDWSVQHCSNAEFVLFADDDYYINPFNIEQMLTRYHDRHKLDYLVGYVWRTPMPKRSLFNKWYVSLSEYPYIFWPPYPTGGAFIASRTMCKHFSIAQRYVKYLRFDDVFIGIVLKKLGISPSHHELFYFTTMHPITTDIYENVIAMHLDRRMDLLYQIWRTMHFKIHDVSVRSL